MFGAISGLNSLHDVKIFNTTSGLLSFRKIRPCWWSSSFAEVRGVHIFCLRLCSSFEPLAFGSRFTAWNPGLSLMSHCYRLICFLQNMHIMGNSHCVFGKSCSDWGKCVWVKPFSFVFLNFIYLCIKVTMDWKAIISDYWKLSWLRMDVTLSVINPKW